MSRVFHHSVTSFHFRVDGKHFYENEASQKRWCHDNHVISLPEFSINTNPRWPVIVALSKITPALCGCSLNLSEMLMKTNLTIHAYKRKERVQSIKKSPCNILLVPKACAGEWKRLLYTYTDGPSPYQMHEHHIYDKCNEVNMLSFSTKQDPWAARTRWRLDLPFIQWQQNQRMPVIPGICQF